MSAPPPSAGRPFPGRSHAPSLMAGMTALLLGLMAGLWAIEARVAARGQESQRLIGLADAFAAHVNLTLDRYLDLMGRTASLSNERAVPPPQMLTEVLLQNTYLLGIRILEGERTLLAVERPGSHGALSWPAFHGHYAPGGATDIHMHSVGVIHLHRYLGAERVVEMVIDRQALLNALAPLIDTPGRSVGLFTEDGLILARVPQVARPSGGSVPPPALDPDGRLLEMRLSPFDGLERLIAWTRVDDQPLLLAATMPLEAIDAAWRSQARLVAIVWAVLSLGTLLLAHRFARASVAANAAAVALHRSEAELSALFHQNRHLLGFLDTERRLRRVNDAAVVLVGASEADVLGRPFWDTPWWTDDPDSQERLRELIPRVAAGETLQITAPHISALGEVHIVESSLSPIRDERGAITGILAEGRDITDRLRAERDAEDQRRRLEMALETTEQGIWDWTLPTDVVVFSDQVATMLGDRPEDWTEGFASWRVRVHPDDLPAVEHAVEDHLAGRTRLFQAEYRMRRHDGAWAWILDKGKVVEYGADGRPLRLIGTHTDITERREAEDRLKALARALEDSNRNLEQFAYVASHDLQEPLRMVSSYLGLLKRRKAGDLDDEALEFIGYATDGALRMSQLITDLLDFSRVTTRGHPFAPVPLDQPLDEALSNLTMAIDEAQASVEISDGLPTIQGDAGQLTQLFQNLLGNAIKYARPDVPPRVRVDGHRTAEGYRITVRDSGIGIEPPYRERIFRIFQRLHSRDTFSGTGIGLAVAQRIVERHGGRIWVEDAVPGDWTRGSAFVIDLPLRAAAAMPAPRDEPADA